MRVNFRQGIVSHQAGGFLTLNPSGHIDLVADNRPVTITIAHRNTNYTHIENNSVTDAWLGPFSSGTNYWIYWDFDLLTFARTFGKTTLEPVAQSVEPGHGNSTIVNAVAGDAGIGFFVVEGHFVLPAGKPFAVTGSALNNGNYTVASSTFNGTTGETTIVPNQAVASSNISGSLTLDIDSYGNPLRQTGRHWFDTANNRHYVWQGTMWVEVLRVFAARVVNGTAIFPQTITLGSFTGTQIGNTASALSGRVLFDESSEPLRRDDRTFFTTEDQFFANAARVDAIRLESNVVRAQFPYENTTAAFSVVAWKAEGKAQTAEYNDTATTVVGILTEDVGINEVGSVIVQGVVTNPSWNWMTGVNAVPIGTPLWIDVGINKGNLTPHDPHLTNGSQYPIGRVPVARVLSNDTIVFEQGLGGKGDQGPPGSIEDIPPATTTELGGVTLTYDSSVPELAIVVSDTDPRLTDARTPLAHTHEASDVTFTPAAGITATDVDGALVQLGNNKLNKSGGTMTGFITLHSNPTSSLHAVPKQYVDSLVSGLVWLDPICLVNLISDTQTIPPGSPQFSDAYIVPPGATGAWSLIPSGHVVAWDGSAWLDRGAITDINPTGARFGVSMTSTTVAGGSFVGQDNKIALFDNTGSLTGFQTPVALNAVYACNTASLNAFNQYVFDGTEWKLFGGGQAITADGTTTVQVGNVLSVKQFSDGGTVDALYWQGLEPADLASMYSPVGHTHGSLPVSAYTTSPNWGTPNPVTLAHLVSTTLQGALEELTDKKALKTPYYNDMASLPAASSVEGMFAYVKDDGTELLPMPGAAYSMGLAGWQLLARRDHIHYIPYDMAFYIKELTTASDIVGSIMFPRQVSVSAFAPDSVARCETPPDANVSLTLRSASTEIDVGTVTFPASTSTGTIVWNDDVTFEVGDRLQVRTQGTINSVIRDISIVIVGCAPATACTLPPPPL